MVSQGRGCPLLSGADQGHFAGYTVMQHGTHCTQWSNKTRWLLWEVHSNNNSLHLYFVFHLEVSCYILNLIKAPAASRITDNSQGPSVNPSGVWRAGNRYWLKTLLQNSSLMQQITTMSRRDRACFMSLTTEDPSAFSVQLAVQVLAAHWDALLQVSRQAGCRQCTVTQEARSKPRAHRSDPKRAWANPVNY